MGFSTTVTKTGEISEPTETPIIEEPVPVAERRGLLGRHPQHGRVHPERGGAHGGELQRQGEADRQADAGEDVEAPNSETHVPSVALNTLPLPPER